MKVVMLHSVGNNNSSWSQNWLSVSIQHFENFCKFLNKNNYETLFLDDWYKLQDNPKLINDKQIVLTLDDGYLDNWVFAFPLLKKYNLNATIFINPDFVDSSLNKRHTLEDVWSDKIKNNDLHSLGFLNWEEIKFLDKSQFIDIQSHSMTHDYYFKSDKIIDFYLDQDDYHWVSWFLNPKVKPYWMNRNLSEFIPKGYPIFEFDRALKIKRFIPSKKFIKLFINEFDGHRKKNLNDIHNSLIEFSHNFKKKYGSLGKYESKSEQIKRYKYELTKSKLILEEKLNKKIEFLCWPGGGYNDLSINISELAGYKASTVASSDQSTTFDNSFKYKRIKRFGLGSFTCINGNFIYNNEKNHLVHLYKSKCGDFLYDNIMRLKK